MSARSRKTRLKNKNQESERKQLISILNHCLLPLSAIKILCSINNNPTSRNGANMIREPLLPLKDSQNMPRAMNNKIKIIPPAISCFHETARAIISANAGMLCVRNASICLIIGSLPPKASRENIIMKSIARIARIRESHNIVLSHMGLMF